MVKYFAYVNHRPGQDEPPQLVEQEVVRSVRGMGLEMPPVRLGWFSTGRGGGSFSTEQFPGSHQVWYWEVK